MLFRLLPILKTSYALGREARRLHGVCLLVPLRCRRRRSEGRALERGHGGSGAGYRQRDPGGRGGDDVGVGGRFKMLSNIKNG